MDDLPELLFEKVLSYLSLKDRLNARAVSRGWRNKITSFKVNTLCYSSRKRDFIEGKSRLVSKAFAQNFINSTRFASFFDTFGQTILSSLKHLRLCGLELSKGDRKAFTRILNSFSQLERLDIIEARFDQPDVFNLNLPMLTSLQLENVDGVQKLTLEAPTLREVKLLDCSYMRVEIVPGESVERLLSDRWECNEVKKFKNLRYLYTIFPPWDDSTFLPSLPQLKEVHVQSNWGRSQPLKLQMPSGRADLKIYLCGLRLNGPDDPAWKAFIIPKHLSGESLVRLAENPSRLADEIPFYSSLHYSAIEAVAPGLEVDLLKRFADLNRITVDRPIQDIERFLNLLKNFKNITELDFDGGDQQDLYDRLPEHSAVQLLILHRSPPDLTFLFRLKHLIRLNAGWPINSETVRRALEELPALSSFLFQNGQKIISIVRINQAKQFDVSVDVIEKATASDVNAVIEFIFGNKKPNSPKKHKAEALE